ncbi:MAG: hypothetical protein K9L31_03110, partial [Candidatus Pacebacteria bacterium]|nr:hypothetical protein [Candidatus Paceibacterota bacterium]
YPTYNTGTTYPTYDTGTTYPTYNTGTTYPTYDTGVTYSTYSTGVTPVTYSNSSYSFPSVQIGIGYGSTGYNYGSYAPTVGNYGYTYGSYTNTNNTVNCPSGSSLVNGTCQINSVSCPSGSVLINNTCTVQTTSCPSGSVLINGTCTVQNTSCPSGSTLVNGVCTITTVNTNYTCWNGTIVAYSSLCPVNYQPINYTQPTVYQPPVVRYPTVTPIPTVKFNNVVTSVVTQITNNSGRCNGIGLIANGSPSTGWFEYGETSNLGRTTASAQIGRSSSAPFSNVLASLKSNTRYYCRDVMQNEYGIVKGEIVSFVTKGTAVAYVQPVTTVKKTVTVTKKVVTPVVKKPTLVTCTDGSSFYAKNETQATILNQGEKLVTLQVEKSEGEISSDALVSYKIVYRNVSDSRLTGVLVKVVIPSEIKFSIASSGNYDESTHTLTLNQDTLGAHSEGIIAISGRVVKNAPVGKSIVATAYVVYTVPGTQVQDEVTAYVVSSIVPTTDISNLDTGAKKVVGYNSDRGFMPNNLVEWLALIAIIFIIFILGRSIYVSYKEDEEGSH